MRPYILATAIALAATSVACNGGSATPPPIDTGTAAPTATPRVISAHLSWTGAAHSTSTSATSARRMPLDLASPEPIEIGIATSDLHSIPASSLETQATLLVTFTDQNGIVAVPPTGAPSVTIANASLASPVPQPTPSASPSAGPVNVATINAGSTTGSTSATVAYPNGATSTIGVRVYDDPSLECPGGTHPGSFEGFRIAGGSFPSASSATADFYLTGPACADKSTAATTLHAPLGYKAYGSTVPVASITTALPFVQDGTALTIHALQTSAQGGGDAVLVVKGASGDFGKFRVAAIGCGGDVTLCDSSAVVGSVAAYGTGGLFSL